MKYLRTFEKYNYFKLFKSNKLPMVVEMGSLRNQESEIFDEVVDIFSYISDYNLYVSDVYKGNSYFIGNNEVIIDYNEFSNNLFKSFVIRLEPKVKDEFDLSGDVFGELKNSIGHIESYFGLKLEHVYLRTLSGIWFNSVDKMHSYIENIPFDKRKGLKYTIFIDLTFKYINNENIKI
jgi:hypothetical protein